MTKYYPVTEDELTQIKNDCYYPSVLSCDNCEFGDETIGCKWKGANILMDEVLERVDFLDTLEKQIDEDLMNLPKSICAPGLRLVKKMIVGMREGEAR